MKKKLVFVHTVLSLSKLFDQLVQEIFSDEVDIIHVGDELLLDTVLEQGGLSPFVYRRVSEHAAAAEAIGADVVQITCSSISPCVDVANSIVGIPVMKIDEPMIDQALSIGQRIGVVATAKTTLEPTIQLIEAHARIAAVEVEVDSRIIEAAYKALNSGEMEEHDRLVREEIKMLMERNDVVILAQASMARVLETIPEGEITAPVLTSPRAAVEQLKEILKS